MALAGLLGTLTAIVILLIEPGVLDAPPASPADQNSQSPAVVLAAFLARYIFPTLFMVAILGAVLSVILRYRRADRLQRAQMKWVMYVLVLGISLAIINDTVLQYLLPEINQETVNSSSNAIISTLSFALPVVIGIAILRYRLYDIDIIIRRTLVYGLLTVTLALVYLGSVVLLQRLLSLFVDSESPLVLVASTLLIAALFNPLRLRIQTIIDRRFYRRKYDARETLTQFAATMQEEADLQRLVANLVVVVEETIQPEGIGVWLAASPDDSVS